MDTVVEVEALKGGKGPNDRNRKKSNVVVEDMG